jgi:uncharacterized protein (TIGR02996 family)
MARRRSRRDPTRDALLAAVAAEPEVDVPRLVMADWLDENGDPLRAEFIRTQLEVRRLDFYTARSAALRRRVEELHKKHGKRWLKEDGLGKPRFAVFRRGFIEKVTFDDCAAFLRDAPGLADRTPLLAAEVLCETPEPSETFIDSPLLERLRGLHVGRRASLLLLSRQALRSPTGGVFQRILQEEQYEELRRASLAEPDPPGLRALLLSPRLANLRELDLSGSWFEPGFVSVLRLARPLANLRSLDLTDTSFPDSDFAHLAESPHLANLRELYLCGADSVPGFHQEGAAMLAGSPYLRRLEVLNVRSQHLERAGFEALARWPGLASLRRLDLESTGGDDPDFAEGVRALAHSPHWGELRELNVEGSVRAPEHAEALLSSPKLASLRVLRLDPHASENEDAGDAVGWMLVRCPYLGDLIELDLGGYKPGAAVRKELVARFGDALTGYGMRR